MDFNGRSFETQKRALKGVIQGAYERKVSPDEPPVRPINRKNWRVYPIASTSRLWVGQALFGGGQEIAPLVTDPFALVIEEVAFLD